MLSGACRELALLWSAYTECLEQQEKKLMIYDWDDHAKKDKACVFWVTRQIDEGMDLILIGKIPISAVHYLLHKLFKNETCPVSLWTVSVLLTP